MAKPVNAAEPQPGLVTRVTNFYEEVRAEMDKVTWPTLADLKVSTQVTLYMLGIMAAITFVFDQVFQQVMLFLLRLAA
jgi:preprotein translocase SecE subunit